MSTAGRLTGLVVASPERSPMCPDVPTVVEIGMPDMVSAVFYGLVGPAGVPRPVVERLNALCLRDHQGSRGEEEVRRARLLHHRHTPEAYLDKLKFETERWTKVVKDNDIKVEG